MWLRRFDDKGNPTHAPDGSPLDTKAASKAAKEAEKLRKQRAPLEKRLADDPQFLHRLRQEAEELAAEVDGAS